MDLILNTPLEVRLAGLFVFGSMLASFLNLAVYRWAWHRRSISPWSTPLPEAPPRQPFDRVPILGWLGLRRESDLHGASFWIRPMLIELGTGLFLAWLYWWEVEQLAFYAPLSAMGAGIPPDLPHWNYLSHVLLTMLMLVATFIDIDEKTIPSQVTDVGTLLGLLLALLLPWSMLPMIASIGPHSAFALEVMQAVGKTPLLVDLYDQQIGVYIEPLLLSSPNPWPAGLQGAPGLGSLALGLACFWFFCFAILPRPWYPRHGLARAFRIATARLLRSFKYARVWLLLLVGTCVVVYAWYLGGIRWATLLSSLVGMVTAGGIVWVVRIIGAVTLRREAMGFGDVLLMMMIGAFLGWQASLMIFFLAPFAGLVIGVAQFILHRDDEIPYGPFLCLAALFVLLAWPQVWERINTIFLVPWLIPAVMSGCMVLMVVLLLAMRFLREKLSS